MDDLISRQAMLDGIDKLIKIHFDRTVVLYKARKVAEDLPSAQPEQRWVPVSERLPEDYVDVLVWFEYFRFGNYNRLYQTWGIGDYSEKYGSWMVNHESGWHKLRVIAWMPLPEAYQEGGE